MRVVIGSLKSRRALTLLSHQRADASCGNRLARDQDLRSNARLTRVRHQPFSKGPRVKKKISSFFFDGAAELERLPCQRRRGEKKTGGTVP